MLSLTFHDSKFLLHKTMSVSEVVIFQLLQIYPKSSAKICVFFMEKIVKIVSSKHFQAISIDIFLCRCKIVGEKNWKKNIVFRNGGLLWSVYMCNTCDSSEWNFQMLHDMLAGSNSMKKKYTNADRYLFFLKETLFFRRN